ncbi:hypothetical protein FisN_4Hh071 [Fistulifera solaris]|uniref:Uncharacterized protein n=1 Tax=Fistulifera solaris TaxID=1519565 RepID=A0A1Z5KEM4_FISSO|nr:hypothetical protein FisN_4Hh071 [Fistulifera solaris]|eukprot:GAX24552.1 hypothetical protein FisN_4Hh071 [Fistulifera solaris]
MWQLPIIVTLVVVLAALAAVPHRELDWKGTVIPLAHKYYDLKDTTNDEPLQGKIVVVTGCTSGIGLSMTKALSKLGATVVGIGRSSTKLNQLKEEVSTVQPFVADFTDLASVAKAADEILSKYDHIDILINNAGMHDGLNNWKGDRVSAQGHDMVFTVNYLSHFLLTEKLSAAMHNNATQRPTIVQVASSFHYSVDGSDLMAQGTDNIPVAAKKGGNAGIGGLLRSSRSYSNSKLAQILHARALRRNHPLWSKSPKARIVSVCPGIVGTNIGGRTFKKAMDLGFPVDGWGIATPLMAIFMEDDKGDYLTSASVFGLAFLSDYFHHPMFYLTGVRDAMVWVFLLIVGAFQRVTARVASQRSSVESYDEALEDSLYQWSLRAVQEYL